MFEDEYLIFAHKQQPRVEGVVVGGHFSSHIRKQARTLKDHIPNGQGTTFLLV